MSDLRINAHTINDEGSLEPLPVTELSPAWAHDSIRRWVDVQAANADEIRAALAPLDLHPLALECCLEPGRRSRVSKYGDAVVIEFQLRHAWIDPAPTHITVIGIPSTLLTLHPEPIPVIDKLAGDLSSGTCLVSASVPALLYCFLDQLIDDSSHFALLAREQVLKISLALDDDSESVELSDVVAVKRQASRLAAMAGEQVYCITSMRAAVSDVLHDSEMHDYFRDLADVAEKLHAELNRLESRARDLYQDFVISLQEVTTSRLRILTVLSAVYLPATLIAGIYGMNFEHIPVIEMKHGYALVICVMAAVVLGQLAFFYRRGWFK